MPDGSAQADRCVSESGREIELDAKQSTTTRRVFDGDRSAMRLSQPLNDAEPKSRSVRAAAILAPEAVEDVRKVDLRDPRPVITDCQLWAGSRGHVDGRDAGRV